MQKPRQKPFRKPCKLSGRKPEQYQRRRARMEEGERGKRHAQKDRPEVIGAPSHEEEADETHDGADREHALQGKGCGLSAALRVV